MQRKTLRLIWLLLALHAVSGLRAQCPGPSQRIVLINLQKSNVQEGSRAGQLGLTDTCGNQRYAQYVEVNLDTISYVPTTTGNTQNLSEFVIAPDSSVWYIDWQGNAIRLSGSGGPACDADWLKIQDNGCPDSLTNYLYKYVYASIGARGIWPTAELLVSDSTLVGMAVISGNRNGRLALHDNANDNWSVIDQGGSTTRFYVQQEGLWEVVTGSGSPQSLGLVQEHLGVNTLDSTIIFYLYPNTRVDTQTAINFLYTDNLGIVRSKMLSQILGDSARVYNLSTINPLPAQYQKSTSFARKDLSAGPDPDQFKWISNGAQWLELGFVLDTNRIKTEYIKDDAVTYPKIQNVTANRLLGRVGTLGNVQEIKLGTNLFFSNDTLNAVAGGAGQTLTSVANSLVLSGGGSVLLNGSTGISISTPSTSQINFTVADQSATNELQTLGVASNTTTLSAGGGSMTIAGAGINTVSTAGTTITVTGTEVDGSTTNEIQALTAGDGAGDNKTLDLSLGGGTVTLDPAGILTMSRTGNTLIMTATEVDGSVSNELQTLGVASNTTTLSAGGGSMTIAGAGINTVSTAGTTITVTGTEVDGSVTNELQTLGVAANTTTLSAGGGSMTIAGAGINTVSTAGTTITVTGTEVDGSTTNEIQTLTAGDGAGDNKTLNLSLSGGTVTLDPAGILTMSRTGNTLIMTATEVDGSVTNEGIPGVSAGGSNDALLISNTSGATGVTVAGGTGIAVTETPGANGGTITITSTVQPDRDWLTITNLFPTVFDSFIYRRKPASIGTNIFRKASDNKHTPFQVVDSTGYTGFNAGVLALFSGNRRGGIALQDNNEADGAGFGRIVQRGAVTGVYITEGGSFDLVSDNGNTLNDGAIQKTRFTYYTADNEGGTAYWPDYKGSRNDTASAFTMACFGFGGKMVSKPFPSFSLTNWTEGFSSATQNTSYFLATNAASNVNAAIIPKGTGAVLADIPDGLTSGGNARGQNAVDLQTSRSLLTEVASGTASVVAGGSRNQASNSNSTASGGFQNRAVAQNSFIPGGSDAYSYIYAQGAHAGGIFGTQGDAQMSEFVMRRSITGTAQTELFCDGTSQRAVLANGSTTNRAWVYQVQVVAITSTVGNGSGTAGHIYTATYTGNVKKIGTTTSTVGSPQLVGSAQNDASMSTAAFTIDADDTNDSLRIQFTPPSTAGSTTVTRCVASVRLVEVGY